jgi:hypothetical protein
MTRTLCTSVAATFLLIVPAFARAQAAGAPQINREQQRPLPRAVTFPPSVEEFCSEAERQAAVDAFSPEVLDAERNFSDAEAYKNEVSHHIQTLLQIPGADKDVLRGLQQEHTWAVRNWEDHAHVRVRAGGVLYGLEHTPIIDCSKLTGIVTDEQGRAIDDASIELRPVGPGGSTPEIPWWARSGRDGRYGRSFSKNGGPGKYQDVIRWSREPGRYTLIVRKSGFEPYGEVIDITADKNTIHDVVLTRKPGVKVSVGGGINRGRFFDVETEVCSNRVNPDFRTAGYEASSCAATSVSNTWYGELSVEKNVRGRLGIHAGLTYQAVNGPRVEYTGTRVRNDLLFQGGGNYDLSIWQASVGPSVEINDISVYLGILFDRWKGDFDIQNQLRSAGQVVNESNASGSRSGLAINFGAAFDWYFSGPVGIHLAAQSRRIDDVVKTDVTGLPVNDRGYSLSGGLVFRLHPGRR